MNTLTQQQIMDQIKSMTDLELVKQHIISILEDSKTMEGMDPNELVKADIFPDLTIEMVSKAYKMTLEGYQQIFPEVYNEVIK